jgi:hypothetical protein
MGETNPQDVLKREAGYQYILERVLRHYDERKGPKASYVILDCESTVRYASPSVEHLIGYVPEAVVGKQFGDFLSWDLYSAALRGMVQRADRALALSSQAPAEKSLSAEADAAAQQNRELARQWYSILTEDLGQIRRVFSPPGKVASVNELVKEFVQGGERKYSGKSKIRIRDSHGDAHALNDDFTLYQHPDGGYAGMLVLLTPMPKRSSWKSYFTWKTPDARIVGNEYVVPVYGMSDKTIIQRTLAELVAHAYDHPTDQPLVLDLGLADEVDPDAFRAVLALTGRHAEAGTLVVGNAPEGAKDVVNAYYSKKQPVAFVTLEFPPLLESPSPDVTHEIGSHEALATHLNKRMNQLEERAYANAVSGTSVPPVQTNPQG